MKAAKKVVMLPYHLDLALDHNLAAYPPKAHYTNSRLFQWDCCSCGTTNQRGYRVYAKRPFREDTFSECSNCKTLQRVDINRLAPYPKVEAIQGELL